MINVPDMPLRGERGPKGDHGQTGDTGLQGPPMDPHRMDELTASFHDLGALLGEYAASNERSTGAILDVQRSTLESIKDSDRKVKTALKSNLIGVGLVLIAVAMLVVASIILIHVDRDVSTIRTAQVENTATSKQTNSITKSTNTLAMETAESLAILQKITGPAAIKAEDAKINKLLNTTACTIIKEINPALAAKGCPIKS